MTIVFVTTALKMIVLHLQPAWSRTMTPPFPGLFSLRRRQLAVPWTLRIHRVQAPLIIALPFLIQWNVIWLVHPPRTVETTLKMATGTPVMAIILP